MRTAIAQAKSDGVRAVDGVKSLLPNSRFAVVVFRDDGNPAGEYQVLQPLTNDAKAVEQALGRITAQGNPSPNNTAAESYNLAFHQSYSDPKIGWNASARKIVVVLGDAEPNGAGAEGLAGCRDKSHDPHGLSTRTELANMRAARRTLIMIRETSSASLTVSLQCYESLAAGAFTGGAARDAGSAVANLIVNLIKRAYLPVRVRNDVGVALRNSRTGYTITLPNPNPTALKVRSLSFELPAGFRYLRSSANRGGRVQRSSTGRTLSWTLEAALAPDAELRVHVVLRTPARLGRYRNAGSASVEAPDGSELVSRASPAFVHVKRRLRALRLRVAAQNVRGSANLSGQARVRFGRHWHGLPAAGPGNGRLVLRQGSKRVVLKPLRLRLDSLAVPTRTRLLVRVAGSRGYRHCGTGTTALVFVTESGPRSRIAASLPRSCGGRFTGTANIAFVVT